MITDLVLNVLKAPFLWLLSAVPSFSWPSWFSASGAGSIGEKIASVGGSVASVDNWIPVSELSLVLLLLGAAWAFSLAVQGLRFVVSLFTGGGGSL